jgi:hypothetical protein
VKDALAQLEHGIEIAGILLARVAVENSDHRFAPVYECGEQMLSGIGTGHNCR